MNQDDLLANPTVTHWATAYGKRLGSAVLRAGQDDFFVSEQLNDDQPGHGFSGQGEHLYLFIEKRGDNTQWLARQLARNLTIDPVAVGFSGLKDRHGVTQQWFSAQLPRQTDESALKKLDPLLNDLNAKVLKVARHSSKLRRGEHQANEFRLILRNVQADPAAITERISNLSQTGFPNYFGPQRFGHHGENITQALQLSDRDLRKRNSRRGILLSAARAWLFNEYLSQRVKAGNWRDTLPGDPLAEALPSGPLFGDGGTSAEQPLRDTENQLLANFPKFAYLFDATRMQADRRALVCLPDRLAHTWLEPGVLQLTFVLPKGAYATALLSELVHYEDAQVPIDDD